MRSIKWGVKEWAPIVMTLFLIGAFVVSLSTGATLVSNVAFDSYNDLVFFILMIVFTINLMNVICGIMSIFFITNLWSKPFIMKFYPYAKVAPIIGLIICMALLTHLGMNSFVYSTETGEFDSYKGWIWGFFIYYFLFFIYFNIIDIIEYWKEENRMEQYIE